MSNPADMDDVPYVPQSAVAKDASTKPGRSPLGGKGEDRIITIGLINITYEQGCIDMLLHTTNIAENNGFFTSMRSMRAYIDAGGGSNASMPAEPLTEADIQTIDAMMKSEATGIFMLLDGERTGLHIFEDVAKFYPEYSFDCAMMLADGTEVFKHFGARVEGAPTWKRQ